MTGYRRNRIPGGTYFFTVNQYDRKRHLLIDHIAILRDTIHLTRKRTPFHIDAWVVLPEHMHCLWTLPEDDTDFSRRWNAIKINFSRNGATGEYCSTSRVANRRAGSGIAGSRNTQ